MKNWYQLTESETLDKLGVQAKDFRHNRLTAFLKNTEKMCLKKAKKEICFSGVFKSVCRPYGNNPYNCGNRFNVFGKC